MESFLNRRAPGHNHSLKLVAKKRRIGRVRGAVYRHAAPGSGATPT
jgi:hypothetical protein